MKKNVLLEKRKKVGFYCEPAVWETFKLISKHKNSDANKELRKFIERYIKENRQLAMQFNLKE